jgi:hypothetical protein
LPVFCRRFAALSIFWLPAAVFGDQLVLRDGSTIEWRILKDAGDVLEVQTPDNRTLSIPKKDVKEVRVTAPKAPLTGATFTTDTTKGGVPANVLSLIDPKKHAGGDCRVAAGVLVCSGTGVLEIPHIPNAAYDVELTVERREGEDELHVGLIAGGRPFSVQIDWSKGQCTGLSSIDGKLVFENETRTNGRLLPLKRCRTILCAVREDCVVVLVDGKEFLHWKGDPKRLSLGTRPAKEQNLFLAWNASTFAVSKYTVTPRT